jgi:NitT/TauT family transport system permease protein
VKVLRELWFTVLVLILWASVTGSGLVPAKILPSPLATLDALKAHVVDGSIEQALAASAARLIIGYVAACALGLAFGLALSFTKEWAVGVQPVCLSLLSMPSVTFVPLMLLWFGPTDKCIIATILIHSTISMALATIDGAAAIRGRTVQAARVLGARGWYLVRSVTIPAALPSVIGGAKQAWAYAFRALLSGELLVRGTVGLGQSLDKAKNAADIPTMIAVLMVVALFSQAVDALVFRRIEAKAVAAH